MRPPQSNICCASYQAIIFLTIGLAILLGVVPVKAAAATPQFTAAPTILHFRGVVLGQSENLMTTVTNTGPTSVTVATVTSSNPAFKVAPLTLPLVLQVGESVNLSVGFTPTAIPWTPGVITLADAGSNPLFVLNVDGGGKKGEALSISPSSVSFGQVAVGKSLTVPVVVTNTRPWNVPVPATQMIGNGFSMSGAIAPFMIEAGQSITLNLTFQPQSAGTTDGNLALLGPWIAIPLTGIGTAVGQLSLAPAPLNFGSVPVGTTQTQSFTMSAVGGNVTVSSAASTSSQFILNGASFPFTIPAGQQVSFNVAFTPTNGGLQAGSLSFVSNASTANMVESLSGTGTITPHSVDLWWNASSDVAGYNIYRSMAANGSYQKINPTLNSSTAYTDSSVVSGNSYYYAATSVNASGQESALSTPVEAIIP